MPKQASIFSHDDRMWKDHLGQMMIRIRGNWTGSYD